MQPLVKKDKERELKKKNAELQSKVENLEKKCAVLEVNKKKLLFFMYNFLSMRAFHALMLLFFFTISYMYHNYAIENSGHYNQCNTWCMIGRLDIIPSNTFLCSDWLSWYKMHIPDLAMFLFRV